jgi:hypothetical protein
MGFAALGSNTTGQDCTALGTFAATHSVTGLGLVAIGLNAMRFLANGTTPCTSSIAGVYLGQDTKASANGTTNEIVIGYNAVGNGTNTVTLGHTTVEQTYLRGKINFTNDLWHGVSSFGAERFYFESNGSTIYKGYGTFPHQWMDSVGNVRMKLASTGSLVLHGGVWHRGPEADERVYYEPSAMTFYKGYGSTPHQWMNSANDVIMALTSAGVLQLNGATVSYGAADSGGTGFKVLRVPN